MSIYIIFSQQTEQLSMSIGLLSTFVMITQVVILNLDLAALPNGLYLNRKQTLLQICFADGRLLWLHSLYNRKEI